MPSDANGNYSLPDGYLAITGNTILASQHNPPLEDLAESMSLRIMATGAKPFSGPAKFADGTVSSPGITMASATSSGWYKTADGWGFSIGGVMVAEFTAGGLRTGARYVGELFDWTGSNAPSLCVLPYGQTLSRTTYARLWAFAQIEIAAGNTLYNNGNGSTTFGIPDFRGRVRATKDNMGGVGAVRLSSATITPDASTLGGTGGTQTYNLTLPQLPTGIISSGINTITVGGPNTGFIYGNGIINPNVSVAGATGGPTGGSLKNDWSFSGSNSISVTSNNTSGSAHPNVQPTIITNCALYAGN